MIFSTLGIGNFATTSFAYFQKWKEYTLFAGLQKEKISTYKLIDAESSKLPASEERAKMHSQ